METARTKVLYLPRYVSAMQAPKIGVSQRVPDQLVTLFEDCTVPSWSFLVKYTTKFAEIP